MDIKQNKANIAIIDLKAFYSSVECIDRGLDPNTTPLVVTDLSRGPSTIVLSVTPFLKKLGIPSRLRLYELPKGNYIYATPRMERYLQINAEVISIILDYVGEDDIHIYSIDELFINLEPYLVLYNQDSVKIIKTILKRIKNNLSLTACAGIGSNMFLAKCALDLEAKKNKSNIAIWTLNDVPSKLHPITPLSKVWGISSRLEKKLNNLGLFKIGDIAHCPKEILIKKLGVIGEELFNHSNGIDKSNIREKYIPKNESLTFEQVLKRNYHKSEIPILLREMCDEITLRLRLQKKFCTTVHLRVSYSHDSICSGFAVQTSLIHGTDDDEIIYEAIISLLKKYISNFPVRKIGISLSGLYYPTSEQLSLFKNLESHSQKRNLQQTIDAIRIKFGKNAILRTDSLTSSSTIKERHLLIGGHKK